MAKLLRYWNVEVDTNTGRDVPANWMPENRDYPDFDYVANAHADAVRKLAYRDAVEVRIYERTGRNGAPVLIDRIVK